VFIFAWDSIVRESVEIPSWNFSKSTLLGRRGQDSSSRQNIRPDAPRLVQHLKVSLTLLMVFDLMMGIPVHSFADQPEKAEKTDTASPIKHVIVIIPRCDHCCEF
jgi:hypothetical protein